MNDQEDFKLETREVKSKIKENPEVVADPTKDYPVLLNSGTKKRKRKISPDNENDNPVKIAKKDSDFDIVKEEAKTGTKTKELSFPDSFKRRKRSLDYNRDSDESPSKKLIFESNILRPGEKKKIHIRKRMKYLLTAVLDQMEFYFGDSNLSKDRYLRKIIDGSPDGYVDLSVFGNFNKLQSLHKDGVSMKVLAAAIKRSKLLELNEDETKVRRSTAIQEISQEEIDSRTVYVEHLPAHANHAWIRSIFSQCGKVAYISLPVYKTTQMIKGFAFVEFENSEEAAKACMMLNNPLPDKVEEKPGMFPKGNKDLNRLQKMAPPYFDPGSIEENMSSDQRAEPKLGLINKKIKKKSTKKKIFSESTSDNSVTNPQPKEAEAKNTEQSEGKKKKKNTKRKISSETTSDNSATNSQQQEAEVKNTEQSEVKKKKKKKKKKSQEKDAGITNASVTQAEGSLIYMSEPIADEEMKTESELAQRENLEKKEVENCERDVPGVVKGLHEKEIHKKKKKNQMGKNKEGSESQNKTRVSQPKTRVLNDNYMETEQNNTDGTVKNIGVKLSRKERKRLRQEDIRRKKLEREGIMPENIQVKLEKIDSSNNSLQDNIKDVKEMLNNSKESKSMITSEAIESQKKERRESDSSGVTSILKSKKGQERKKVEFDPVPVTTEFVKGREVRKRKKLKKEKPHLRVIKKNEWLSLKAEYIAQQKSHMAALKESLRELRQQENQNRPQSNNRVDLEDVFGTKRLKPSQDLKMAHVESLKFVPNVIVQWKCSHDMHRDKIRTMFKEMSGDSIAYIDAKEEAKFGYIRFKDEASAEEFTKLSRHSTSFMARLLPADQQEEYWKKANEDRVQKLGRKKHEKGMEKIARKVFERNKATFFQKPSHILFNDENDTSSKERKEEDKE